MKKLPVLLRTGILSLVSALVFVSTIFITDMLSVKSTALTLVYMVAAALVYGLAMKSDSPKSLLLKWGISLPLAYLVLQYFWATHYSVRALNWLLPGHGSSTAGGHMSGAVLLAVFAVLCIIAVGIAQYALPQGAKHFTRVQWIAALVLAVVLIVTVMLLEQQFPSYQYVAGL